MVILYLISAIVVVILLALFSIVNAYKKVPPNQAMIVFGLGGKRVVQGGGTFVIPGFQNNKTISMMLMSFDVIPAQAMFSRQGIKLNLEAVAQIKIKSDPTAILTASEQFIDRPEEDRETIILHSVEGHLRGLIGQLTVESILKTPDEINSKMRETCSEDLDKMGLEVVSFTIKKITDDKGYIDNMGVPEIERIRRDASIAKAEAERDIQIKQAEAEKESAIAKANAHQATIEAGTAARAKESLFEKDLNIKQADFKLETEVKKHRRILRTNCSRTKLSSRWLPNRSRLRRWKRRPIGPSGKSKLS